MSKTYYTYYCVTSTYDDKGQVTAMFTSTKEGGLIPQNTSRSTPHADIYNDWFDDLE